MRREVEVGEMVRSFDFDASRDCYVEGLVVATHVVTTDEGFEFFDCPRYKIEVKRRVWDGIEVPESTVAFVYPPMNGTPTTMSRVTNNVVGL